MPKVAPARWQLPITVGATLIAGPLLAACHHTPASAPDIVLVLASGLREDIPGVDDSATAFLDAAGVAPGLRFRTAWVQDVQPYVAMGTLLTGFYPAAIPLCSAPIDNNGAPPWCVTPPVDRRTLPEVLDLYGYRTALVEVVDPDRMHARGGTDGPEPWRGYGTRLQVPGARQSDRPFATATQPASAWWAEDTHEPRLLVLSVPMGSAALSTLYGRVRQGLTFPEADRPAFLAAHPEIAARLVPQMAWTFVNDATRAELLAEYHAAAVGCGADLKQLLATLSPGTRPRYTVVTSLWGTTLREITGTTTPEQADPGSHQLLIDRVLRVPLLVSGPDVPVQDITDPVELIDLMPTLARVAGAVLPAGLPGRDLLALPTAPEPARAVYAEYGDMMAVRDRQRMLIYRTQTHGSTSIDPEFTTRLLAARPPGVDLPDAPPPSNAWGPTGSSFQMYDVADDVLQAHPLPLSPTEGPFVPLYHTLVDFRTGPAALPADWLDREHVQALRRAGVNHYF